MDINSIIAILLAIVIIYFFIKLVLNPAIKVILGVIVFILIIYILQRMGINFQQLLSPFGISFNAPNFGLNFNWILGPIDYLMNQGISTFTSMWDKVFKP